MDTNQTKKGRGREKESRTKESMRMMGMSDWPYWLSWFVYYSCINTALTAISWFIIQFNVIGSSNKFLIWLFMWLYGEAIFGQIVFLQSWFSTSKVVFLHSNASGGPGWSRRRSWWSWSSTGQGGEGLLRRPPGPDISF